MYGWRRTYRSWDVSKMGHYFTLLNIILSLVCLTVCQGAYSQFGCGHKFSPLNQQCKNSALNNSVLETAGGGLCEARQLMVGFEEFTHECHVNGTLSNHCCCTFKHPQAYSYLVMCCQEQIATKESNVFLCNMYSDTIDTLPLKDKAITYKISSSKSQGRRNKQDYIILLSGLFTIYVLGMRTLYQAFRFIVR